MSINATILGQMIAFFLFVFFCMKYVWPPLMAVIENRQKEISDGLTLSEKAKEDLKSAKIKASEQIKQAKEEAHIIIEQANKRRMQIINHAKSEAKKERIKILVKTKSEIKFEQNHVCEELRKQIASLIIAGAEKIIERSINEDVNSDILDKFISKL